MIHGRVDSNLSATVIVAVTGPRGDTMEVEAIIDTGFNGFLTLPLTAINDLILPRRGIGRAVLANGSTDLFDIYAATVDWDGAPRTIEVDAVEAGCLLGMAMMKGFDLHLEVIAGGNASINARA